MSNDKFQLNPDLHDASLEKACEMANDLVFHLGNVARRNPAPSQTDPSQVTFDLSDLLEYLRLNFDLVPKK